MEAICSAEKTNQCYTKKYETNQSDTLVQSLYWNERAFTDTSKYHIRMNRYE